MVLLFRCTEAFRNWRWVPSSFQMWAQRSQIACCIECGAWHGQSSFSFSPASRPKESEQDKNSVIPYHSKSAFLSLNNHIYKTCKQVCTIKLSRKKREILFITLGVCPLTFPARAREPWTLPIEGQLKVQVRNGSGNIYMQSPMQGSD